MTLEINRADMKLLTECGYSGIMRNIAADVAPIFEALETWMPDQAAGPIGIAMQSMVAGDFEVASERLTALIASDANGKAEARAILAMCKALQKDMPEAERLAGELKGQGGSAEVFATVLTSGSEASETRDDDQRPVTTAAE